MPSSAGTGLRRRLGPLSVGGWLGVAGGSLALLWLYRRYEAQKAAAAAANPPLSGGTTIPAGGTTGAPVTQAPTLAGWEQAAISAMTGPGYSATQAFNDIANWLSGNPVSPQGATELGNAIATLGLPPVGGTLGPITVASTSTSPPTGSTPNPPATPPSSPPASSPSPPPQQTAPTVSPAPAEPGVGLFGTAQIHYLQNLIGQPNGISSAEYADVANAYEQVLNSQGAAAADSYHYVWNGPGQVSLIPAI